MTPLNEYNSQEEFEHTPLLDTVDGPEAVRAMSLEQLTQLADEIRRRIIATVSANGGHLASPLGVVELTLALHHVFDAGKDRFVWDVGHQCYPHKLITGRRSQFHTLRKKDGIAGYPKRSESLYDAFDVGHSSTSISAALGMAVARDRLNDDATMIAIIGDGSMTAGMALEALSHAGHEGTNLLVVLNDNEMSISRNVGALSAYFNRLITNGIYNRAKEDVQSFMQRMLGATLTNAARRIEHSVKGIITPGGLFQELGFHYIGPVDGHDLHTLLECLTNIKKMGGPILFHCVTTKGKGYPYAEENPQKYHGVSPYDIWSGEFEGVARPSDAERQQKRTTTFTEAFAEAVVAAAEHDERVAGITAAMPAGTGLSRLQELAPDRFFDVGICEQHAVTFAAGMAAQGMKPVCAIYSSFFQRSYDQFVHDVCLPNLPVVCALDRAGLVGEDAPTHSGIFDLSFLRPIPNATIAVPRDGEDLGAMVHWALTQNGPVVLRYPRGSYTTLGNPEDRDVTRGEVLREGADATFVAVGPCVGACLEAAQNLANQGLSVAVADARFVKPLDTGLLDRLSDRPIITVEENVLAGGFGAAVMEYFEQEGRLHEVRIHRVGLPDAFDHHATRTEQLAEFALDGPGLTRKAETFLHDLVSHTVK